ncbi:MAG: peptidoglycan recognition protein family protein [Candidatus Xenobia bacterium]
MSILDKYHIYSCAEWGARAPSESFWRTTPRNSVVHHMDWPNRTLITDHNAAVQKAFQVARSCQEDHMDNNGWADTGQNFTVTRDGVILEGRHGSLAAILARQSVRAAHAADPDTGADDNDSPGTEHEGTYSTEAMPQAQWEAAVWLQAFIAYHLKQDTDQIIGHRDTGCSTACPGDWLESQLPRMRDEAHAVKLQMIQEVQA